MIGQVGLRNRAGVSSAPPRFSYARVSTPGSHGERSLAPLMDPRRGPPVRYVACKSAHYLRKPASSRPLVA